MANKTSKAERQRLAEVALIVAQVAAGPGGYQPTLTDPAVADAFDAAMESIGRPERAWRGTAAVRP